MGFNFSGLIVNKKLDNRAFEMLMGSTLSAQGEVDFDEATSAYRDENTLDILQTEHGTLALTDTREMHHLSEVDGEIIHFIISDVADTYYFAKYSHGTLQRKYISSQGEVYEDVGEGYITPDDDLTDLVWELADRYLQNNFSENMFDLTFKHYALG